MNTVRTVFIMAKYVLVAYKKWITDSSFEWTIATRIDQNKLHEARRCKKLRSSSYFLVKRTCRTLSISNNFITKWQLACFSGWISPEPWWTWRFRCVRCRRIASGELSIYKMKFALIKGNCESVAWGKALF